jgi:methionine-gamma-lyase
VFQRPIEHGADLSLYSLTKFRWSLRSHCGRRARFKGPHERHQSVARSHWHSVGPHSCWMLSRSLRTLSMRMEKAVQMRGSWWITCATTPRWPRSITLLTSTRTRRRPFVREAMHRRGLHVLVRNRRRPGRCFQISNALQIFKLAVSLGGTKSLASLPACMTHGRRSPQNRDSRLDDPVVDRHRAPVRPDHGYRAGFERGVAAQTDSGL